MSDCDAANAAMAKGVVALVMDVGRDRAAKILHLLGDALERPAPAGLLFAPMPEARPDPPGWTIGEARSETGV